MKQKMSDFLKVSVTKSRPGQLVGLGLEEEGNRIMVTDVYGLLKKNNLPVHVGDELLDVNGSAVMNKHEFPRGLKDIQMFLLREWHICVKVRKGPNASRVKIEEDDQTETFGIVSKETKKWNDEIRDRETAMSDSDWDSEDSSINLSGSDNDDERHTRPRSRSANPRRRKPRPRSASPFSAFSRAEKRKGKKKNPVQLKAFEDSISDSISNSTGTTQEMSSDDNTPSRTEQRTCQTGSLVDIDENDAVLVSPLSPHNETKPQSSLEIKSIHGTDHGIKIELDDGKTVSISPEQLLAAVSENKDLSDSFQSSGLDDSYGSMGAPTASNPSEKSRSKKEVKRDRAKLEKKKPQKPGSKKALKSPKRDRPRVKAPRRSSMPNSLPSKSNRSPESDSLVNPHDHSSLRNYMNDTTIQVSLSKLLAQHTERKSSNRPSSYSSRMSAISRTCSETKEFMNELRSTPKTARRSSMPMLASNSSFGRPLLTSITEDKQQRPQSVKKSKKKIRSKSPDSLPDETMLGSAHSTRTCMTNLIDPGDLMKIHGFKSKPKFNGATVEVVRKSKGHKGKRWDVRVVSKRHIQNTSFNGKRLISVSRDNLKHFR